MTSCPQGVAAWNAAQRRSRNATVRGWVEKLAGEGSWQWVFGVGIWGANLAAGFQELAAKDNAELRGKASAANDQIMQEFLLTTQMQPPAPAAAA